MRTPKQQTTFITPADFNKTHHLVIRDSSGEFVARYTTLECCAMTIQNRVMGGLKDATVLNELTGMVYTSQEVMRFLRGMPIYLTPPSSEEGRTVAGLREIVRAEGWVAEWRTKQ